MENVKDDLRTHNIDFRDVTDVTRDRTIRRNLVQTHRQFTWWKRNDTYVEIATFCESDFEGGGANF